ncbi:MAG: DUF4198 domain-containing protein [Cellvibrionaceae bacterium]|nr:DUF4198 domain-containing protein [Cellvibrionaceae bacterium]
MRSKVGQYLVHYLFAAAFSLSGLSARAHTPYLVPTAFEPLHDGWISLDAGFADVFFQSDVAFDQGDFKIQTPKGQWVAPGRYEQLTTRSLVEHQLKEEGTYRFSTGLRKAAVFRMYEIGGERKFTRDPAEVLPEGAKLLDHYQSATRAETYVSLKAPTQAALKPLNQGLEIVPLTHPNDLYTGETLRVALLLDGKPLAGKELSVFAGHDGSEQEIAKQKALTDAEGRAEFKFETPGVYLLYARQSAPAPKGAPAPNYGYVYTLTFAVNPQ